eukprot:scaffold40438_cov37-Tisochrysis_lutea.AAC.2
MADSHLLIHPWVTLHSVFSYDISHVKEMRREQILSEDGDNMISTYWCILLLFGRSCKAPPLPCCIPFSCAGAPKLAPRRSSSCGVHAKDGHRPNHHGVCLSHFHRTHRYVPNAP